MENNNLEKFGNKIERSIALVAIAAVVLIAFKSFNSCGKDDEIKIEGTPVSIEEIMPKGELYLCSAIGEECEIKKETEKHALVFSEEHTYAIIIRQKCSYKIDFEDIEYNHLGGNKVLVKLPEPTYIATTKSTTAKSDDEGYWIKHMPNDSILKRKAMDKIKQRFATKENKDKAKRYAEASITEILRQLGYEAEFVSTLKQTRE